ncbi:hypothetical protein BC829DRAFT_223165 [Chytridium lagenaria]|nr:hypothetical protein BC829DRAFT_223165 [Chytridium lagenaria]
MNVLRSSKFFLYFYLTVFLPCYHLVTVSKALNIFETIVFVLYSKVMTVSRRAYTITFFLHFLFHSRVCFDRMLLFFLGVVACQT